MLQEEQPDQGLFFGSVNKIIYSIPVILITGGFLKEFNSFLVSCLLVSDQVTASHHVVKRMQYVVKVTRTSFNLDEQ